MSARSSLRRARRRQERGVVLIEVIIVVPLLLMLMLASFDLGLAWRDSLTVANAARSAARVSTNLGTDDLADHSALLAAASSLGSIPVGSIERVVIYKRPTTQDTPPAACLGAAAKTNGGDALNSCNVYDSADLAAIVANPTGTQANFSGSCGGSRWDRFWCPTTRNNSQGSASGPDYVGIWIQVNHAWTTKLFGTSMVLDDYAVMRIEPNAN